MVLGTFEGLLHTYSVPSNNFGGAEFASLEFESLASRLEEFESKLSTLMMNEKSLLGQLEVLCEYRSVLIQSSRFLNDVHASAPSSRPSMIVQVGLCWMSRKAARGRASVTQWQ
jgi:hypothetical protein